MSGFDYQLHRRTLLRWMALTGSAAIFPNLPVRPRPALNPIQEADLPALTAANPVLHTDDEPTHLQIVKLIFERQGWTMIGVIDSLAALKICRTQPISLVISDIMKPDMSGLELLQALRADPATRDIPLMFLSACGDRQSISRARELGAADYLSKPYHPNDLIMAVRAKLLWRGRWQAGRLT